jgi:hypothetical protein
MVDTLADVQYTLAGSADPTQGKIKNLQGWFISACLLCRSDVIECNSKLWLSVGEKIVVDVGNDR